MKHLLFIMLLILLGSALWAEKTSTPVDVYLDTPNPENFMAAVNHLYAARESDTTDMQIPLMQEYLYLNQAQILMEQIRTGADSLSAGVKFQLGNMYMSIGEYTHAITCYQSLNQETPNWSCPWRHKGEALYRTDDLKAAVIALQQAIETNKKHYDAYIWLALTYHKLHKKSKAKECMEIAKTLDPNLETNDDLPYPEAAYHKMMKDLYPKAKKN